MIVLSFDLGFRNLSYCLVDFSAGHTPEIIVWGNESITDLKSPTTSQVIEAGARFILRNEWTYLLPDMVVFEAQMRENPKMVKLSSAMHSAITVMSSAVKNPIDIHYVKPFLKFKYFLSDGDYKPKDPKTAGQLYKIRKDVARDLTIAFLEDWKDTTNLEYFTKSAGSCRDMADSLTNGCAFARLKNLSFY